MTAPQHPEAAFMLALSSLPKMGPKRLAALLGDDRPERAWARLTSAASLRPDGVSGDTLTEWRRAARLIDVGDRWRALRGLGITMSQHGRPGYPDRLLDDLEPPLVLFARGQALPAGPTVAIVGTRQCTAYGRRVAFELGAELAVAGVSVISGLALGIDAAAHRGALSADGAWPVGVVGSGLDVVYPTANRELWQQVAERGSLLSEAPPGSPPERWRFPARNRIIAGLADAVVVVESHARGGALLTADEAVLRDVPVGAVPGPVTASSSAGTNALVADGAVPVLGVDDLLLMIDHVPARGAGPQGAEVEEPGPGSELLAQMGFEPRLLEQVCLLASRPAAEVAIEIERLVALGYCVRSGPWIERVR